tara:strand:+ start:681 stop:1490 length:810 start_codon:yes stop_codon:yes gene_type:complete
MINKNIIVLGSKGMLGNQVLSYFRKKKYLIKTFDKRFKKSNINSCIKSLNKEKSSIIINCIGKIKQKKSTSSELFWSNTILVNKFVELLNNKHLLIHPSTDCVFSGKNKLGNKKNAKLDALDDYGLSKTLAEKVLKKRTNTLIIRTSIVGIEKKGKKALLGWFLSQKKTVYGYTDHFWNGVTTLKWCEFLEAFLSYKKNMNFKKTKIIQIGTKKKYSKYQLLNIFKNIFGKKILIIKKKAGYTNKYLKSDFKIDNFKKQIKSFKEFNKL